MEDTQTTFWSNSPSCNHHPMAEDLGMIPRAPGEPTGCQNGMEGGYQQRSAPRKSINLELRPPPGMDVRTLPTISEGSQK